MARDGAALFRRYDEIFIDEPLPDDLHLTPEETRQRVLHGRLGLFTCFLDTKLRTRQLPEQIDGQEREAMGFALQLRVPTPDYHVDRQFQDDDHYEGSSLFNQDFMFLAYRDGDGWGLAWGPNTAMAEPSSLAVVAQPWDGTAATPGDVAFRRAIADASDPRIEFWIPLTAPGPPAFAAWLKLTARWRND